MLCAKLRDLSRIVGNAPKSTARIEQHAIQQLANMQQYAPQKVTISVQHATSCADLSRLFNTATNGFMLYGVCCMVCDVCCTVRMCTLRSTVHRTTAAMAQTVAAWKSRLGRCTGHYPVVFRPRTSACQRMDGSNRAKPKDGIFHAAGVHVPPK